MSDFEPTPDNMSQAPTMGVTQTLRPLTAEDVWREAEESWAATKGTKTAGSPSGATSATSGTKSKSGGGGSGKSKSKGVPSKPSVDSVAVALKDPTVDAEKNPKIVDTKAKYTKEQEVEEAQRMALAVAHPPAPEEFRGLQVGPTLGIEYEPIGVTQVELSNPLLRNLSPFMIRVEPPLVYGENGGFQNKKSNNVTTDFTVGSGYGTDLLGYDQARRALAQSGLAGLASAKNRVNTVQEFVVANGQGASKNPSPTATRTDKQGNLGLPAIADVYTAMDIARQLSAILTTPPLVLLINPTTLTIAYNKVQQYQERSRQGFIFQAWGEEQVKLSITARCGAFVSGQRGVQFASRRDSAAWQNLMNAFHLYRNNGYIYDTVGQSYANHLVGALSIHYDGWTYYGHMESFTYTLDEEHMHGGVEFSIDFVASAVVDTAQQVFAVTPLKSPVPSLSDPRYQSLTNMPTSTPGVYSAGTSNGQPVFLNPSRAVGVGDAFLAMVPQSGVANIAVPTPVVAKATVPKTIASSAGGWSGATATGGVGQRTVTMAGPGFVDPFRVRSST